MEYISHTAWLAGAATAADKQGPGTLLRTVLAVLLVGAALMAWFLLRGYRDRSPEDGTAQPSSAAPGSAGKEKPPEGGGEDASGAGGDPGNGSAGTAATGTPGEPGNAGRKP